MNEIQHDPVQWPNPDEYRPERFDLKDPDNKWTKTSDGKPRNPLAFTPFYGGKRICLGKTFAEVMVRFTLPLIFFHCDFAFTNPKEQMSNKQVHTASAPQEPKIPLKLTIKHEVKL